MSNDLLHGPEDKKATDRLLDVVGDLWELYLELDEITEIRVEPPQEEDTLENGKS